jgi:hypothetical protein
MSTPSDPAFGLPYPNDTDKVIRDAANKVSMPAAIEILDKIHSWCGNAEKVAQIGEFWGTRPTMNDCKLALNTMRDDLSAYWKGPAYNAFSSYTINTVGVMDKDMATMGTIASTIGSSVTTVFSTYATALTFMGNTAAGLTSAGVWGIIGAATSWIPAVNLVTWVAAINKAVDLLKDFIKDVTKLIADGTTQMGQYKTQGLSFVTQATQFQHPEPLPGASGQVGGWQVNPNQ